MKKANSRTFLRLEHVVHSDGVMHYSNSAHDKQVHTTNLRLSVPLLLY